MRNRGTYLLRVRHQSQYGLEKTLGSEWRQYEEAFPKLQTSKIDIISLECHNSRVPMDLLELIRGKKSDGRGN